tara:strand:- start:5749 stop:6804 length:1056 start_codon:yes stop_codon:yes gene_type:complete
MSKFIQLHLLTSYAPSNLNRDDLGRPKTAMMGGTERLRISSQSLKRNWRISDVFQETLQDNLGLRTKRYSKEKIYQRFIDSSISQADAAKWSEAIASQLGKVKNKKEEDKDYMELEQLVHLSPQECSTIDNLVSTLITENREPSKDELTILSNKNKAIDIALFGRMLASSPKYNIEAACQVAHAISIHPITVEDDYFTAVDDLNDGEQDAGASHIGESSYASAVFYSYICIDKELLVKNLDDDLELANQTIAALTKAATTVSPRGKQNSFAARTYASYVMVEKGDEQPRSLSSAFLKSIRSDDYLQAGIDALKNMRTNFAKVYGSKDYTPYELSVIKGEGSFNELVQFAAD